MKSPITFENVQEWKEWLTQNSIPTWDWENMYPGDVCGVQFVLAYFHHRFSQKQSLEFNGTPPDVVFQMFDCLGIGSFNLEGWNPSIRTWIKQR